MSEEKKETGKPFTATNEATLPAAAPKPAPGKPGEVRVTSENAPLVMVALLQEIRDQNKKILAYYEEAANA